MFVADGQEMHALLLVAPAFGLYVPAGHGVHVVPFRYAPALHLVAVHKSLTLVFVPFAHDGVAHVSV